MISTLTTFRDQSDETSPVGAPEIAFTIEEFDQWNGRPGDKGARPCFYTRSDSAV